ncbi:MAG: ABC transporter permease [Verrucomicrobia bacterium]|nr:ABC transporter permease [Verrucomicrobiota bacterium]
MSLGWLALRNLLRRRLRHGLMVGALAVSVAVLVCLSGFGAGYERALRAELDGMGVQLMLVPLGCPYDAAARVMRGRALDNTLPEQALAEVRNDPAVAVAAPLLTTAALHPDDRRVDLWVGLDESGRALRPWWRVKSGAAWFTGPESVILGSEAAAAELRVPGDQLFCPAANRSLRVSAVLERSGTSDDSLFFVPLLTAQEMFDLPGRLTAIAIRLHDPGQLREATARLQQIAGAQVVTLTEMMGVFLNLVGSVRVLLIAIATLAMVVCALGLFNTMLAGVLDRAEELAVMRALGASRHHLFGLVTIESLLLAAAGIAVGLPLAAGSGHTLEGLIRPYMPLAPLGTFWVLTGGAVGQAVVISLVMGLLSGLYPAWRAGRVQPAPALKGD